MRKSRLGSGFSRPTAGASILAAALFLSSPAAAQTGAEAEGRSRLMEIGYININGGYQIGDSAVLQRFSQQLFGETAAFDVRHATSDGVALDGGLGLRVWNNLAVGAAVTRYSTRSTVVVTGEVPHPLFTARHRDWRHELGGYHRTEIAVHVHAVWTFRLAERIDVAVSAGPSHFNVKQDRVAGIRPGRGAPPDYAVEADFDSAPARAQAVGANVGVDVTYHLIRRTRPGQLFWTAGIGVFARWTTAMSDLTAFGPDQTVEVGGVQSGIGLRFRF